MIVEIGIKLDKDYEYYKELLESNNLINDFNCVTHDIYFTNKDLNNLSETEMKNACIRFRSVNNESYKIQNNLLNELKFEKVNDVKEVEELLKKFKFLKIFDTIKKDHHFYKEGMTTKVQLQEIKDIGLLVYFDNEAYYNLPLEEQRKSLIDELNSYGFNIDYNTLGLDKLRTLYYKKELFSINQNS